MTAYGKRQRFVVRLRNGGCFLFDIGKAVVGGEIEGVPLLTLGPPHGYRMLNAAAKRMNNSPLAVQAAELEPDGLSKLALQLAIEARGEIE